MLTKSIKKPNTAEGASPKIIQTKAANPKIIQANAASPKPHRAEGASPKIIQAMAEQARSLITATRESGAPLSQQPSEIRQAARTWLADSDRVLPAMTASEALEILKWRDTLHRLAYGQGADLATTHAYYRQVLRKMASGQKADRLPIMRHIDHMLATAPKLLDPTDISWYTAVLRRWQREATAYHPLAAYPLPEALGIASFLLSTRLPGITEATFAPLFTKAIATHAV